MNKNTIHGYMFAQVTGIRLQVVDQSTPEPS